MKIVYLESALEDLAWLHFYYEQVFPEGQNKAVQKFENIQSLLLENPRLGHPTHQESTRELSIPQTPFSFIYRIQTDRLEILRVWDERQQR